VVFGLSTDYEVFLLSRMVEAHDGGADTTEAARVGTVRTARVVTAAATLLVLVTGAFALSPLTPMRMLGLGMIIALVLDATLVRMLLVPATVRLLGAANWWSPFPRREREAAAPVAAE
uniref:MMPL family transporter n=2 Tax=Nocardia TaxID=1817 RepID=UPI002455B477